MEIKELKFEDLSTEQKLGMVTAGIIRPIRCEDKYESFDVNLNFVLDLIRKHSLGAVWIPMGTLDDYPDTVDRVREAADYPILIFTDAESGLGEHKIGRHNALGIAGDEELAYTFGKLTAITARKMGYNVVCDPVLDLVNGWEPCSANNRSIGCDKHTVARIAASEARGLHDGGVLTVAKHYPGGSSEFDSHMAPCASHQTYEELVDYYLYPYRKLIDEGLLDGIMTGHKTFDKIDPDHPTSVSRKMTDIIRGLGFDGFMVTDALDMMGLRAKFGDTNVKGLCVMAGNEFILPWFSARRAYADLTECYKNGMITDDRLDEAVKRVLAAQHKVFEMKPKFTEITEEDKEKFDLINKNSIFARTDEGLSTSVSKDGKHFFVMIVKNDSDIRDDGKVTVDTFTQGWYFPARITRKLEATFPNSTVRAIYEFPTPNQNMDVLQDSLGYEDVIFITYAEAPAYAGADNLTHRVQALINAMLVSGKLSTVMHFGNPFTVSELDHVPRLLIGGVSEDSINAGIDVLAGDYPALGKLTYDVKFK